MTFYTGEIKQNMKKQKKKKSLRLLLKTKESPKKNKSVNSMNLLTTESNLNKT